jgi:uncharacterized membrane protein
MTQDLSIRSIVSERVTALAVTLFTIGFWLVIATYPDFFLFNALETPDTVFRIEQMFSTIGWIAFAIFPMLFAWVRTINGRSTELLYQVTVGLWPLSILVIQVTMAVRGFGFYAYIGTYPVLAFTDILVPLFLLAISKAVFSKKA